MNFLARLKLAAKEAKFWLLFNALGFVAYLCLQAWLFAPRIPEEAFNGIDQLCFWTTMQLPLLCLYLGVNLTWLAMSGRRPFFKSRSFLIWICGCSVWGILLLLDPVAVKIVYLIIVFSLGIKIHDSDS